MHSWNKRDTRGPFYHCLYSYKTFLFKRKRKIFRCESEEFNRLIWSKTYSLTILKASQEGEKFGSTLALEIAPWNKLFKSFLHGRKKLTWIERIASACEWQPKLKSQILQRNGRAKITLRDLMWNILFAKAQKCKSDQAVLTRTVEEDSGRRMPPAVLVGGTIFSTKTLSNRGTNLFIAVAIAILPQMFPKRFWKVQAKERLRDTDFNDSMECREQNTTKICASVVS